MHLTTATECTRHIVLPVSLSIPLVILFCLLKVSVLMSQANCMLLPRACDLIELKVGILKVNFNTSPWSVTGPLLASFNVLSHLVCSEK